MGSFVKLLDLQLFFIFLLMALVAPLLDAHICLPHNLFPKHLIDLKQWYADTYEDFLVLEKPNFFVGLVWLELIFLWPLSLVNLYAFLASKPWFNTTCLIYGVSVFTSMAAILAELVWSGRASEKLLKMYIPFVFFSVVAIIRGLIPDSGKTGGSAASVIGRRPILGRKKKA